MFLIKLSLVAFLELTSRRNLGQEHEIKYYILGRDLYPFQHFCLLGREHELKNQMRGMVVYLFQH